MAFMAAGQYTAQYTRRNIHGAIYTAQYTRRNIHGAIYTARYTRRNIHRAVYTAQYMALSAPAGGCGSPFLWAAESLAIALIGFAAHLLDREMAQMRYRRDI
jgi:hypothetical protein